MDISQTHNLSANSSWISAKLLIYQPILHKYQPNPQFISQLFMDISQTSDLSANSSWISAKLPIYQPTLHKYQPNHHFFSQLYRNISQTHNLSANSSWISAKPPFPTLDEPALHRLSLLSLLFHATSYTLPSLPVSLSSLLDQQMKPCQFEQQRHPLALTRLHPHPS